MEKMIFGVTIDEIDGEEKDSYLKEAGLAEGGKDDYRIFLITSVNNYAEEEQVEYYFSLTDKEGEREHVIQDWGENAVCIISKENYGEILKINVRKKDTGGVWNNKNSKLCKYILNK